MATEEWIQESLGRLESLEEERKRHEDALETESDPSNLRMHAQAVERLEVKIRALYAELEAIAAQDSDSDDDVADADASADDELDEAQGFAAAPDHHAPSPTPVAAPFAAAPAAAPFTAAPAAAPFTAATPEASPFGGAPTPSTSPFGGAPAASPFGDASSASAFSSTPESYASPASTYDDSDSDGGGGSGSKVGLIIAVVLVLGGAGAYFAFGRTPAVEDAPPPAPTEIKVIKSGEVPPDTQGPRAAKGGDVDVAHGAQIKETERRTGGGGGGGSSHTPSSSDAPKKKKEDKATKIEKTDDPLGGIR